MGKKATGWDEIFTQNGPGQRLEPKNSAGWTGGDSTYSIKLPNGNTAFFFSDSYIAESPEKEGDGTVFLNSNGLRTHKPNCLPPLCRKPENIHYVHNSIVIRSADGKILTTKLGEKDNKGFSTSYFKPKDPEHFFWVGDSAIVQTDKQGTKKIWVFLFEWEITNSGGALNFEFYGTSIAQLNAETLAIEKIKPLTNIRPSEGNWGAALWSEADNGKTFLHIYGIKTIAGKKKLFIARVNSKIGIDNAKDVKNWEFLKGEKWVAGQENGAPIIPEGDSVSDELSVKKVYVGGKARYLLVTMNTAVDFFSWKDIYIYSSCTPQGPFINKYLVYTTPESGSDRLPGMIGSEKMVNKMVIYNPHFHPQFTENGELLISYNSNLPFGAIPGDTLYADFYRPRFIRVRVKGLQ